MNLLVILSALLTALTGVMTGARPVQAAQQEHVVGQDACRATPTRAVVRVLPPASAPRLSLLPGAGAQPLLFTASIPPLGQRRRE